MSQFAKIILKPGKERAVKKFHPWIFSGAIHHAEEGIQDGTTVEVYASSGEYLATGHFNNGSIRVRIFSFQQTHAEKEFWEQKIRNAYTLRVQLALAENPATNAYRLVHGEGDGLPGLIIDIYNTTAVIQTYNAGMHRLKPLITGALKKIFREKIKSVYDKSADTMPTFEHTPASNGYLEGCKENNRIIENGNTFLVDWEEGQKTGFFIDQRENRKLLGSYAQGKKVLNTFCYTGGFSVYALAGKAIQVDSVDGSKKAIALAEENVMLNGLQNHRTFTSDVFEFFKNTNTLPYDLIVLDPPAFAKHRGALRSAAQGYQRLNQEAIRKINSGGILFTFSCSQLIDKTLFRQIVFSAATETGRTVRILHQLSQAPDHPISIYHPEGEYLKGLVLHIGPAELE